MQKYQNTNMTKGNIDKIQSNKLQLQQNTNGTKYKQNKIQKIPITI